MINVLNFFVSIYAMKVPFFQVVGCRNKKIVLA